MVKSEKIGNSYNLLLHLIEEEAKNNNPIWEYFNYLNKYRQKFNDGLNIKNSEELREFLRGANRYSDEFVFSEENYSKIRFLTNNLYELLDTENPARTDQ